MNTMLSLDSNIILVAINTDDGLREKTLSALQNYQARGYCICPPVYAELRADPEWSTLVQPFLEDTGVQLDWEMPQVIWEKAGIYARLCADKRRNGILPRRILADFLIAAHAEHRKFDVMSFDETVYKVVLEKAQLIVP
jgi:predicted nucleic acid-binding protein